MKTDDFEDLFWGAFLEKHEMRNTQGRRDILRALHRDMLPATEITQISGITPMAVYNFLKEITAKGWVDRKSGRPSRYRLKVELPGWLPTMSDRDDCQKIVLSIGQKTKLTIALASDEPIGIEVINAKS